MKRLLLLLLAAGLLLSCTTRRNDFSDGDTIDIHVGEAITLEIPENPTTGYSWEYSFSEDSTVLVIEDRYIPAEGNGMAGAGGVHFYKLKGIEEGDTVMTFRYRRPWEKDTEIAETRRLHLHVTQKRLDISIGIQVGHSF